MAILGNVKFRRIIIAVIVIIVLFVTMTNFITNLLWHYEVGYESVFLTRIFTQLSIGIPTFLIVGASAFFYLRALRNCYYKRVAPPTDDKKAAKSLNRIAILLSAALAVIATMFVVSRTWFEVLQFINATSFGLADPVFNIDISFYVFRLELIKQLNNIFFGAVISFAAISFMYYLSLNQRNPYVSSDKADGYEEESYDGHGDYEPTSGFSFIFKNFQQTVTGSPVQTSAPKSKEGSVRGLIDAAPLQAAVLGVLLFLALGMNMFLRQIDLLFTKSGALYGAGYTDINVRLWVLRILMVLSVVGAVGVVLALKKKNLKTFIATPILMVAVALLGAGAGYVVQNFVVSADEINLERQYLERSIRFTQFAYNLDNVSVRDFPVTNTLTREDIDNNYQTISNIRLNDYEPVRRFYNNVQTIRPYYVFTDVFVDRYMINGEYTQVYIAAREIDDTPSSPIPQSFLNRHIKYTHGYGITLSRVDSISPSGLPEMLIRNIPPESDVSEINIRRPYGRPEIYFGRMTNDFILVNTIEPAFDFPIGGDEGRNAEVFYDGNAGIRLNFMNRLLFSIREANMRIFVSGALTNESRIVINRNVLQRVRAIMPLLAYDSEPYMVTVDGRLFWIVEAYATSGNIPYSESFNGQINYIRNSVKVVIDAFHGTVNYYVVDPTDPIAATYRKIFPELFKDLHQMDEISPELRNHLRYPNMLLGIQANMFRRYHMSDVTMFYQNEDLWDIATEISGSFEMQMVPNYYIMKLPGETKAEFVNTIPFTPRDRRNMSALLVARNDGTNFGELVLFQLPKGRQIPGPMQVDAQISQDGQISQDIALWSQSGSEVSMGNMFVVPIENSFLYVKPIYLEAETGSIPEVRRVVVAYGVAEGDGVRIAYQPTLDAALEELFGPALGGTGPVTPTDPTDPDDPDAPVVPPPSVDDFTIAELVMRVAQAFDAAQNAQRRGDWAAYGDYLHQMEQYLNQLQTRVF